VVLQRREHLGAQRPALSFSPAARCHTKVAVEGVIQTELGGEPDSIGLRHLLSPPPRALERRAECSESLFFVALGLE